MMEKFTVGKKNRKIGKNNKLEKKSIGKKIGSFDIQPNNYYKIVKIDFNNIFWITSRYS